ncbi:MAG: hypothetical protein JJE10_07835 [Thermoleophilia bacterium]|nr:hypothetical protein [Thermoleophilia bacterium]
MSPAAALDRLRDRIAGEGEPLALAGDRSGPDPALGDLASAGARTAGDPGEYAYVVEAVYEGYLCHYGDSRLLAGPDADLSLLAGDLFYAIGISGLAGLGDPESVGILSDLIRVAAELEADQDPAAAEGVWLAQLIALSSGPDERQRSLISAIQSGDSGALAALNLWSAETAERHGIGRAFEAAREAIDLRPRNT